MKTWALLGDAFLVLLTVACLNGCGKSHAVEDPQLQTQRTKYLLAEEPLGAVTVADAKETIKENDQIVLLGRIGAGEHSPWDPGKASFLISDAAVAIIETDDAHHHHDGEGHDHENCPFCNRDKSVMDSLAIVEFTDESGQVLPIDSRELLGVKENQLVVVRGRGAVDSLGNLTVSADGIYVRQ